MASSLSNSAIGEPQQALLGETEPVWSDGTEEATKKEALHLISNGKWSLSTNKMGVERKFEFKTFARTMIFINSIADQCKVKKHHPEWANVYNKVVIRWTTHNPEGLSRKDIEMAKFCDEKGKELGEVDKRELEMISAGGSLDTLLDEGGNDNSPDLFERILAKLDGQIQTQSTKLTVLRQRSRRYKALFTLNTVLLYMVYVVGIVLVVGLKEAGPLKLSGVTGGPVCIWSVRRLIDLYYNYRISNVEGVLEELQSKKKDTIEKLKHSTNYSTTQSIIEKYGGSSPADAGKQRPKVGPANQQPPRGPSGPQGLQGQAPAPPPSPREIQQQLIQQQMLAQQRPGLPSPIQVHPDINLDMSGALGSPSHGVPTLNLPQSQPLPQQHLQLEEATSPKWYDRILDLIVGEDETSAKNRYALICKSCRMVNGLAPPGTTSLNDMEGWGCVRCGTLNGPPPAPKKAEGSEGRPAGPVAEVLDNGKRGKGGKLGNNPTPNGGSVRSTGSTGSTGSTAKEVQEEGKGWSSLDEPEDDALDWSPKEEHHEGGLPPSKPKPRPWVRRYKGRKKVQIPTSS